MKKILVLALVIAFVPSTVFGWRENAIVDEARVGGGYGETGITMDVDGNLQMNGDLTVDGAAIISGAQTIAGDLNLNDDINLGLGSSQDAQLQYDTGQTPDSLILGLSSDSNALIITEQADLGTDFAHAVETDPTLFIQSADQTAVGDWISLSHNQTDSQIKSGAGDVQIIPTGITKIGDAGSTGHTLTANDDLHVSGKLEVDGVAFFDADTQIDDDIDLLLGAGADAAIQYDTTQTTDALVIGTSSDSNALVVSEKGDMAFDFAHALETNPKLFIQSADTSGTTQWLGLSHDQTNAVIDSGAGGVSIPDARLGRIDLPEDGGLVEFVDMAVTSAQALDTEDGYVFAMDGLPQLRVLASSDGTGGIVSGKILASLENYVDGGTADYGIQLTQTLNATEAAGGSDLYTGILANITTTDITGWDNAYLMDLQDDSTSVMRISTVGDSVLTLDSGAKLLIDGTSTRTTTTQIFDMDATYDTTTGSDDVDVVTLNITRATADTGGTVGFVTNVITGDQANTEFSSVYFGDYDTSACTTATSSAAVFRAEVGTVDAQCTDYGLYVGLGFDIAAFIDGEARILGRLRTGQGADVASATNLTLGTDGNTFEITGTTKIDLIDSTDWGNGDEITLIFNESVTVDDGTATSSNNVTIALAGGADFNATTDDVLKLILSENTSAGQAWRECFRSVN